MKKIIIAILVFGLGLLSGLLFRVTHIKEVIQQDPNQCSGVDLTLNGQSYGAPEGYGFYLCPERNVQEA